MYFDVMVNMNVMMTVLLLHDWHMNMLLLVRGDMCFDVMVNMDVVVAVLPVNNCHLDNLFVRHWDWDTNALLHG